MNFVKLVLQQRYGPALQSPSGSTPNRKHTRDCCAAGLKLRACSVVADGRHVRFVYSRAPPKLLVWPI